MYPLEAAENLPPAQHRWSVGKKGEWCYSSLQPQHPSARESGGGVKCVILFIWFPWQTGCSYALSNSHAALAVTLHFNWRAGTRFSISETSKPLGYISSTFKLLQAHYWYSAYWPTPLFSHPFPAPPLEGPSRKSAPSLCPLSSVASRPKNLHAGSGIP